MAITTLIFDLDNTLIDRNESIRHMHRWLVEKYLSECSEEKKNEAKSHLEKWDYFGYVPHEAVLRNFCKTYGLDIDIPETANIIRLNQGKHATLLNGALETLSKLKETYTLALLTNGSSMGQRMKIESTFGKDQSFFQTIMISGDEGIHKPNIKIYERLCKQLNVSPEFCVYIGDDLMNDIIGPMKAGMKAVRLNHCNLEPTTLTLEITKLSQLLDVDFEAL